MPTYARSSYAELRNNIWQDIRRNSELALVTSEALIGWVLRAEEEICKSCIIREEYRLRYSAGTVDYFLQDRPPITGVSATGSPITITSAAHGLAVDDNIYIRDVQGAVNANGRMRVATVPDANSFTIKRFGRITGISDDAEPVVTSRDHPFVTGDSVTISDVLGATEVNGTWAATKIDQDTFSVDILGATRNAYTSGGIAVAATTNSTTYDGGGRYWKEDELPTHIGTLMDSSILHSGYTAEVTAGDFLDVERHRYDTLNDTYTYPTRMALGAKDGKKFLRIDPKTTDGGDLDLLYRTTVIPRNHYDDAIDMSILLPTEHDAAIGEYVKEKLYNSVFKEPEAALFHQTMFLKHIDSYTFRQPTPRMKVVYT